MLEIKNVSKSYADKRVLHHIDLRLSHGIYALLGTNGAGKSTLMNILCNQLNYEEGSVLYNDKDIRELKQAYYALLGYAPQQQGLYDEFSGERFLTYMALLKNIDRKQIRKEVLRVAELVNMQQHLKQRCGAYSGGMKQRVVIAMALACNPKLLLADEPTTALDVTIQAQVLETMKDLRKKFGSAMIMITHDLGIIAEVCDEVSVVYAGQIVEHGTLEDIFNHTMHPYTEGLFGSLPNIEDRKARLQPIPGLMPDPTNLPKGCPFSPRCKYCTEACKKDRPEKKWASDTHYVRCVRYEEPGFSIERSEQ